MRPLGAGWSAGIVAALGLTLAAHAGAINSAGAAVQTPRPRPVTMQDLTVPVDRLPEGCRLKATSPLQMSSAGMAVRVLSVDEFATNPWIGQDRETIAAIRHSMDGAPRLPDGPPPARSEMSNLRWQEADGVAEGYVAIYVQPDRPDIAVRALKFDVANETVEVPRSQPPQSRIVARIWLGPILVVLQGDEGRCSATIKAYVESLAN